MTTQYRLYFNGPHTVDICEGERVVASVDRRIEGADILAHKIVAALNGVEFKPEEKS